MNNMQEKSLQLIQLGDLSKESPIKIRILGKSGIGKETLVRTLVTGKYPNYTKDEVKENCIVNILGVPVQLELVVISLMESRSLFSKSYAFNGYSGVILCYDVSDRDSFEQLPKFIENCKQYKDIQDFNIRLVVVGTKCDSKNRVVSFREGYDFAKSYNFPFFEVSALNNVNLVVPFAKVVDEIAENNIPKSKGINIQKVENIENNIDISKPKIINEKRPTTIVHNQENDLILNDNHIEESSNHSHHHHCIIC